MAKLFSFVKRKSQNVVIQLNACASAQSDQSLLFASNHSRFFGNYKSKQSYCTAHQCLPTGQNFGEFSIIIPAFIVWRTHLVIDQFNFSSVFLCFSLFTISRQPSYKSSILRHDYGNKRWLTATIDNLVCLRYSSS